MKAFLIEAETFAPYKIEILIESKEDIRKLYHRLNTSSKSVEDFMHISTIKPVSSLDMDELWVVVSEKAKEVN